MEVSGGSYARAQLNPSASNWLSTQGNTAAISSGTGGTTSNNSTITFTTATGSWGTVVGLAICDAATNGNILFYGTLSVNKTVSSGDTVQISTGQLVVTLQ